MWRQKKLFELGILWEWKNDRAGKENSSSFPAESSKMSSFSQELQSTAAVKHVCVAERLATTEACLATGSMFRHKTFTTHRLQS